VRHEGERSCSAGMVAGRAFVVKDLSDIAAPSLGLGSDTR